MVGKVSNVSNVACDALESLGFSDSTLQFPKCRMCRIGAWGLWVKGSAYPVGMSEQERTPVLPEPWVDEPLDADTAEALDKLSLVWGVLTNDRLEYHNAVTHDGRELTLFDLEDSEGEKIYGPWNPPRPMDSYGDWKVVRNAQNNMRVALLLREKLDVRSRPSRFTGEYQVMRMVVTSPAETRDITGTDLRDLPLRAITSAYGRAMLWRTIAQNRLLNLADPEYKGIPEKYWKETGAEGFAHILDPLPTQYSRRPWFYALVAEQYDALAREHPDANIANLMVELNSDVAAGSVRRWIARARKECLLPPADWKRGSADAA